jgi:spermidine synthase
MKPWEKLATTTTPDGTWLELRRHDGEFVFRADGYDLMTSRQHGSEDAMMALACPKPGPGATVLIGGLGMGYTLRSTLDLLPPDGKAVVAELVPDVVAWNREYMGGLNGNPLDDPRTELFEGDVAIAIRKGVGRFDAILLDVDNGPDALTQRYNGWLYSHSGLVGSYDALRPKGALAVWSVADEPSFEHRLSSVGFRPSTHKVNAHGNRGTRQIVFIGRKR